MDNKAIEKIKIEQKVYREVVHIICDEQMIPGGRAERIDRIYKQAGYQLKPPDDKRGERNAMYKFVRIFGFLAWRKR